MDERKNIKEIMFSDKERIILLCLTLLLLIINIRHVGSIEIFTVLDDEFGYWGNAAYLAGLDWSGVVSEIPYYSYGYSILLVPLFFIFENPMHMYKAAIFLNGIMLSASFLLCYDIAGKLAKGIDKRIFMGVAFLISMYPAYIAYSSFAWSECLLIFNVWLLTWCFTDLNGTSSNYKFGLVGFFSMYSYIVHQRALGVLLASIIVIVAMKLLGKINLKQVILVAIPIIILGFIHVYLKDNIQTHLWLNSTGHMTNDYLDQASKISQILSVDGLLGLTKTFLGHIFYIGAASYLIGYFGLVELLRKSGRALITTIRNRKIDMLGCDRYFSLYTFLLIAVIFSLSINIVFMINPSRMDHIVYGRYIDMIMGPLVLLGFVALMDKKADWNKAFVIISIGFILLAAAVHWVIETSGLTSFHTIHAVGLLLINSPLSVALPTLTAIVVGRLIIISFTQKASKMMIISSVIVPFCFFMTGDIVARTAVVNQTAAEIIGIVEFIENIDENSAVYFLWDDQGNPAYGQWDNRNTRNRLIADSYQFLLKDIPVKLVNKKGLEGIDDMKFLLTPDKKFLPDLRMNYEMCMDNRYTYLLVSKKTVLPMDKT